MLCRSLPLISILLIITLGCFAQKIANSLKYDHDTTYFYDNPKDLHLRFYFSRKLTAFTLGIDNPDVKLRYLPNTTRNLGIGFTYKWATLNLAYGFGFINPDRGKGETRYLDLQSHQFLGRWNLDFFGQFYRGYYLETLPVTQTNEYVRPDIHVNAIGLTAQYVLNPETFSFKAAFFNVGYQKKSAGTWLVGGNIFYGRIKADSTLIPYFYNNPESKDINYANFLKGGPLAGYAYTFVLDKHFYASGALTLNFNFGHYLKEEEINEHDFFYSTDINVRGAVGYNSPRYGLSFVYLRQGSKMSDDNRDILQTINFRLIFTYRFTPKKDFMPGL